MFWIIWLLPSTTCKYTALQQSYICWNSYYNRDLQTENHECLIIQTSAVICLWNSWSSGLKLIERHRLVNKVLAVELSTKIHALSIQVQLYLRAISSRFCRTSVDMCVKVQMWWLDDISDITGSSPLPRRIVSSLRTVFNLCWCLVTFCTVNSERSSTLLYPMCGKRILFLSAETPEPLTSRAFSLLSSSLLFLHLIQSNLISFRHMMIRRKPGSSGGQIQHL